jgi:type III secretory pathway component EscV
MNKRRIFSLILVGVLAISMLVGCTKGKEKTSEETSNANEQIKQTEQTENKDTGKAEKETNIPFAIVEEFDEETQKLIDDKSKEKGYSILSQDDKSVVIMIASGEKPTGGYGIEVKTAEEKDGVVTITVEETSPAEGAIVTTALTYPYAVIKLDTKAIEFIVVNAQEEEFENLDKKETSSYEVKEAEGIYNGAIDNNSIEIQLNGEEEPMAFRTEELDNFEVPEENVKVKISYYTNEYKQNILKSIEVVK